MEILSWKYAHRLIISFHGLLFGRRYGNWTWASSLYSGNQSTAVMCLALVLNMLFCCGNMSPSLKWYFCGVQGFHFNFSQWIFVRRVLCAAQAKGTHVKKWSAYVGYYSLAELYYSLSTIPIVLQLFNRSFACVGWYGWAILQATIQDLVGIQGK